VKDLITLAKTSPGQLSYASTAAGTSPFLAAELFKSMARVDIVRVLYKGTPAALSDLISGQVPITFPVSEAVASVVKSGKLKALAVTSAQPSPLAPGLPTVAESGLPGYEFNSIFAMFAPAKTPRPVVQKLDTEMVRVINRPDVKEKFLNAGSLPVGGGPDQLMAAVKSDVDKWNKVIRETGIKSD
jgi:tripartite-type tricarboxylate transporter receptor subunit TctC